MRPDLQVKSKWQHLPSFQMCFSSSVKKADVHVWYLLHVVGGMREVHELVQVLKISSPRRVQILSKSSSLKLQCMFLIFFPVPLKVHYPWVGVYPFSLFFLKKKEVYVYLFYYASLLVYILQSYFSQERNVSSKNFVPFLNSASLNFRFNFAR